MTSATERLRALLDERGVEYRVSATGYSIDIGPNVTAYANRTDTTLDVSLRGFTPEQAVAATLGQEDAYTREDVEGAFVSGYSLGSLPVGSDPQWDQNEQTVDEHMAELGWVRKDAATLGETPTPHVEDLGRLHDELRDAIVEILGDRCDWDQNGVRHAHEVLERAATLGPGTCEVEVGSGDSVGWWVCSACGALFDMVGTLRRDRKPNYCPNCGKRVVDA